MASRVRQLCGASVSVCPESWYDRVRV